MPAATILPYCWLQVALHQPRKRSGHVGRAGGAQKVTGCWIDSSEHKAGLKLYQRWKKPCCHLLNRKAEDFQGIQNVFLMGQIRDGQMPFGLVAPVVPSKVTDTRCRRSHKMGLVQPAPVKGLSQQKTALRGQSQGLGNPHMLCKPST